MFELKFSTQMKKAWVWLSLYLLSLSLLRLVHPTEPIALKLALLAGVIANPGILLYLIRLVRSLRQATHEIIDSSSLLSTWGWFWRAFVLLFFQVPMLLLARLALPINLPVNEFTALELLLWEGPFTFASAVGAWLLFSRDRLGQLRLMISTVRGY